MSLLGIDTCTAATAACVLRDDGRTFEVVPSIAALRSAPAHARELMPAVIDVMDEAGLGWGELEAIAVGVGPGGYTGVRIGVATARALAQAQGLPLKPVSSLAALAAGIPAPMKVPLLDAKRGELFAAAYADGAVCLPPWVASPEDVATRVQELARGRGERALAAGDGSLRFPEVLEQRGIEIAPERSGAHLVRALHVCRLGKAVPPTPPEAVTPQYLRDPDAAR